jgi:hypothetical protein
MTCLLFLLQFPQGFEIIDAYLIRKEDIMGPLPIFVANFGGVLNGEVFDF